MNVPGVRPSPDGVRPKLRSAAGRNLHERIANTIGERIVGGQHVNKTDSAVRLTHIPTGVVVACQNQRSQHQNRDQAWKMLKARLYEQELQKREAAAAAQENAKTDIGWGHQIRSYVLAPYQLVKDLRTGVEKGNPDAVLDGALDEFMAAALAQRVGATRSAASADAR